MAHNPDNTTARVYHALLDLVLSKQLAPGSKINQNVLSTALGVSRTPLTKALHQLATQGLVDVVANKGFTVHRLSVNELIDLWSTREALETLVAGDVASRITPEQVGKLRTLFERFAPATVDSCSDEYAVADAQFHATLLGFCRNQLALRINEHFLILERATIVGLLRPPSITLPEHLAIIDALQQHDRRQAMQRMGEHVENTRLTVEASIARIRQLGMDIDQVTVNGLPRLRSGEESGNSP